MLRRLPIIGSVSQSRNATVDLGWDEKIAKIQKAKEVFSSGVTSEWSWRKNQLNQMNKFLDTEKEGMKACLEADLGRVPLEFSIEWVNSKNAVTFMLNNGEKLMKREKVSGGIVNIANTLYRKPEPLGTALIMGAWNYPFDSTLNPLIGAIGAGNTVVVKPSEISRQSAEFMFNKLPDYLDKDAFPVFLEGPEGSARLLKERYDLIFFTGGTEIGKIVMRAAADHLTPVILELGGKNPTWVDESTDMASTAKRLMYGKVINSGQICISPNYVLCTKSTKEKLVAELHIVMKEWYDNNPKDSACYSGKMVSPRHFERLVGLLNDTKGKIEIGGGSDESSQYIEPTVVTDVDIDDILMKDELFGPILPIIEVDGFNDAIKLIKTQEKPLAAYCFAKDKNIIRRYVEEVTSGGMCINDTIMHITPETLPFGGVGQSGMGAYHGKTSFEAFSHYKSVLESGTPQMMLNLRSAPHSADQNNVANLEKMMLH